MSIRLCGRDSADRLRLSAVTFIDFAEALASTLTEEI